MAPETRHIKPAPVGSSVPQGREGGPVPWDPGEIPVTVVRPETLVHGGTTALWALKALQGLVDPRVRTVLAAPLAIEARQEKKAPLAKTVRAPLVPRTGAEAPPAHQAPLAQGT